MASNQRVFKVWSQDRKVKSTIAASSVKELKTKGCQKLRLMVAGYECELVDETDGSVVDDDDVLLLMQGQVFQLLEPGRKWTPARTSPPESDKASIVTQHQLNEPQMKCDEGRSGDLLNSSGGGKLGIGIENDTAQCAQCESGYADPHDNSPAPTLAAKVDVSAQLQLVSLMGNAKPSALRQAEFYRICQIFARPQFAADQRQGFVGRSLSYLLQRIKMRGCNVLQPSSIAALIIETREPNVYKEASKRFGNPVPDGVSIVQDKNIPKREPVSRLDCITCLLNLADSIVTRDLLQIMSEFPMALPLIMRCWEEQRFMLMTPALRGIVIKWETSGGKIIEHSLFIDPFRLVVAVRLGSNQNGKSTILNQLFSTEYIFSSKGEPGSEFGKPLSLEGSVEFICMIRETCKDSLWDSVLSEYYLNSKNEIALLANLHGDANAHHELLDQLKHLSCRYVVFIMPDCTEENWNEFIMTTGSASQDIFAIYVDSKSYNESDPIEIQSLHLSSNTTISKVRNILREALFHCAPHNEDDRPCKASNVKISLAPKLGSPKTQRLIDFVAENSCKSTKLFMQLQIRRPQREKARSMFFDKENTSLRTIIDMFLEIMLRPQSSDELQGAMLHVEYELSRLSSCGTQTARQEICFLKTKLQQMQVDPRASKDDILQRQKAISYALDQLDSTNLGLEHFIRETAQIYEFTVTGNVRRMPKYKKGDSILLLPPKIATLFVNGHPIELLDGDAGDIPLAWFNAVCKRVDKMCPKLRVFVVSILGLQSSGKSTLLNSLFACRFAVSVGRSTRGLFMRLLFLEESIAKWCKFDALLLIDTEGLGSPEKMNVASAEKKDRLLATFAMGISNLVIVNVLGEYMNALTEILQIAILTMARLEKSGMSPNLFMVQHHLTEKDTDKLLESQAQFCDAIRRAVELSEKKDIQCGVRNAKCLSVLFERIQNGTLLSQFHPYKHGATVNSPPSKAYHEDVVKLYDRIVDAGRRSETLFEFRKWHELVENYWTCVSHEDFALRFKNIKEVYEFIERGNMIADVKKTLSAAFNSHKTCLTESLAGTARLASYDPEMRKSAFDTFERVMKRVPFECACELCKKALQEQCSLFTSVEGKPCEGDTRTTIGNYDKSLRESMIRKLGQKLKALIVQQVYCSEFDEIINKHICQWLKGFPAGSRFNSDDKIKKIGEEIFQKLVKLADEKCADVPVKNSVIDELKSEYQHLPDMVQRFNMRHSSLEEALNLIEQKDGFRDKFKAGLRRVFNSGDPEKITILHNIGRRLKDLPNKILQQQNSDCFEVGMVGIMRLKIDEVLNTLQNRNEELPSAHKIAVHIWAQQIFCKRMEEIQKEWDIQHKPSMILQQQRRRYMNIIENRLQCGFSATGDARILANELVSAIRAVAIEAENNDRSNAVKGLVWATNSEKVRLKYFEEIAQEVVNDQKGRAVQHFFNSQAQIEKWFKRTVNGFRRETVGRVFQKVAESEFEHVLSILRQKSAGPAVITNQLKAYIEKPQLLFSYSYYINPVRCCDFEVFTTTILNVLVDSKKALLEFSVGDFRRPSKDPDVMALLGCSHMCYWCGALCWGQRGHEENDDDTKKHHSSHQPRGLAGTTDYFTNELVAQSCNNTPDSAILYFGDYIDIGLEWSIAKEKYFSDWKFCKHYNNKFDQMMRWFFAELHEDIARKYGRLPATVAQRSTNECQNLDIDSILSRINLEVN